MKLKVFTLMVAGASLLVGRAADSSELKDQKQKFSYSVGMSLGGSWKKQSIDIDLDTLMRGIKDSQSGKTVLTETESRDVIRAFQTEQRAKAEAERKAQGEKNKKEGEAFLAENKKKEGVITTASGLQYKVLAEGKGDSPKATDSVTVNYKGTLLDGTEFDSSFKRGQPATFDANKVIKGWTEGLQLMKPGSKYQFFIPADLAYGDRGSGANITPQSTLIFEVELVSVKANAPVAAEPVTSDIIKVPSAEELKAGAKPEVIKAADLEKYKAAEKEKADKAKDPKK